MAVCISHSPLCGVLFKTDDVSRSRIYFRVAFVYSSDWKWSFSLYISHIFVYMFIIISWGSGKREQSEDKALACRLATGVGFSLGAAGRLEWKHGLYLWNRPSSHRISSSGFYCGEYLVPLNICCFVANMWDCYFLVYLLNSCQWHWANVTLCFTRILHLACITLIWT